MTHYRRPHVVHSKQGCQDRIMPHVTAMRVLDAERDFQSKTKACCTHAEIQETIPETHLCELGL
eukprot:4785237-Pyramimonas_sp.AAC.1